jgi:hypothetical protein
MIYNFYTAALSLFVHLTMQQKCEYGPLATDCLLPIRETAIM